MKIVFTTRSFEKSPCVICIENMDMKESEKRERDMYTGERKGDPRCPSVTREIASPRD